MSNDRQLHPAWYGHEPGEAISDVSLTDSLHHLFHQLHAFGLLLGTRDEDIVLSNETFHWISKMLTQMSEEGRSLIDQWWAQQEKPTIKAVKDE